MKTAVYIRVSTDEQVNEGYSISAQKQKLKAFCVSQGWDVVGLYADEGISAKDTNRPYLQRMIQDIKNGEIECVLVYRLDRLTRSVFDLYKLLEVFEQHDCKFKSATEVYDTTTAMGRMFITIVAALAQWERENMGERISFGFGEKIRQGKYPLNFAPLGYDLSKEESKLYINEKEAATVRIVYNLYQSGMGFGKVAKELNAQEIYTKDRNKWTDNTTMKTIRNPIYYGSMRWNGLIYKLKHEPILTYEEWSNTQEIIKARTSQTPRSVSSRYIFSGKLKCNGCGGPMQGYYTTSKAAGGGVNQYPQYRCRNKRNGKCSKSRSLSETKLEKAFLEYLENENYLDLYEKTADKGEKELNKKEPEVDIQQLKNNLNRIENRKKKWQYAWAEDAMSFNDFKRRMDEAQKEEDEIKEKIESAEVETEEPFSKNDIIKILKDIEQNWIMLNVQEKKNLVNSIIEEVRYDQTGKTVTIDRINFKKD
ncbi:putative serine integrase [Virgibacillus phage Mimir87]|nr:putative serine integrase [Virgibacillus phage Mimir87]